MSVGRVLAKSYRRGGAMGLYRSITPNFLRILPYSGLAFAINDQAKQQIAHIAGCNPSMVDRLQCSAMLGLCAQTLAYLLEVTRRRMQTIVMMPTGGTESAGFVGAS